MTTVQAKPDGDDPKKAALALAAKPTKTFHAFARALSRAHSDDPSFLHEVARVAMIKRRALFYLSSVGRLLDDYDITDEQAERIGWTKLQIVARHTANQPGRISRRDMQAKLEIASRTPADRLHEALEQQETPRPLRSVLLRLTAKQYADVEAALIACGATRRGKGLVDKEEALVRLARTLTDDRRQQAHPELSPRHIRRQWR